MKQRSIPREWQAEINNLPQQFAAFTWRLEHNAWIDKTFEQMFINMPLAEKYLAGKKITLKEKKLLLQAFDRHNEINCPVCNSYNPWYSNQQFDLLTAEITALLIHWINALTMPPTIDT
jgi:hypothetical protein